GFFKEAVSAEAVMGYLQTFFGTPSVMRVSVAEHARFKDPPSTKQPAPPVQEAKVVELNNARAARPIIPTVTMEVAPGAAPYKTPPSTRQPAPPVQEAKVVELNNARAARPIIPTVTMEVAPGVD